MFFFTAKIAGIHDDYTGCWFQTFFIFHIWDNPSHRLIFFKTVKTTNQYNHIYIYMVVHTPKIWYCTHMRSLDLSSSESEEWVPTIAPKIKRYQELIVMEMSDVVRNVKLSFLQCSFCTSCGSILDF